MYCYLSGKYCESEGLDTPTGDCDPGYYCPGGQSSPTPTNYSCPEGSYCAGGLSAPVDCPSGEYQVIGCLFVGVYEEIQVRLW